MNDFASHATEINALDGKPRVLYLDDDESNLVSFRANFRNNFEVFVATTPIEAYRMMEDHGIQVVITDHQMPSMSGVDFLATMSRDSSTTQMTLGSRLESSQILQIDPSEKLKHLSQKRTCAFASVIARARRSTSFSSASSSSV